MNFPEKSRSLDNENTKYVENVCRNWTFDLLVTNPDAALELVPKNYENSSKSLCQSITYSITYL